jgi:hypothetical protein
LEGIGGGELERRREQMIRWLRDAQSRVPKLTCEPASETIGSLARAARCSDVGLDVMPQRPPLEIEGGCPLFSYQMAHSGHCREGEVLWISEEIDRSERRLLRWAALAVWKAGSSTEAVEVGGELQHAAESIGRVLIGSDGSPTLTNGEGGLSMNVTYAQLNKVHEEQIGADGTWSPAQLDTWRGAEGQWLRDLLKRAVKERGEEGWVRCTRRYFDPLSGAEKRRREETYLVAAGEQTMFTVTPATLRPLRIAYHLCVGTGHEEGEYSAIACARVRLTMGRGGDDGALRVAVRMGTWRMRFESDGKEIMHQGFQPEKGGREIVLESLHENEGRDEGMRSLFMQRRWPGAGREAQRFHDEIEAAIRAVEAPPTEAGARRAADAVVRRVLGGVIAKPVAEARRRMRALDETEAREAAKELDGDAESRERAAACVRRERLVRESRRGGARLNEPRESQEMRRRRKERFEKEAEKGPPPLPGAHIARRTAWGFKVQRNTEHAIDAYIRRMGGALAEGARRQLLMRRAAAVVAAERDEAVQRGDLTAEEAQKQALHPTVTSGAADETEVETVVARRPSTLAEEDGGGATAESMGHTGGDAEHEEGGDEVEAALREAGNIGEQSQQSKQSSSARVAKAVMAAQAAGYAGILLYLRSIRRREQDEAVAAGTTVAARRLEAATARRLAARTAAAERTEAAIEAQRTAERRGATAQRAAAVAASSRLREGAAGSTLEAARVDPMAFVASHRVMVPWARWAGGSERSRWWSSLEMLEGEIRGFEGELRQPTRRSPGAIFEVVVKYGNPARPETLWLSWAEVSGAVAYGARGLRCRLERHDFEGPAEADAGEEREIARERARAMQRLRGARVAAAAAAKARKRAAAAEAATAAAEVEVVTKTPGRRRFGDSRLGPVALREFLMIGERDSGSAGAGEGERTDVEGGSGVEEANTEDVESASRMRMFGPAAGWERQAAMEEARVHAREAARAALRRLEMAERRVAERWEAKEAEERAADAREAAVEDPTEEEERVEEDGARELLEEVEGAETAGGDGEGEATRERVESRAEEEIGEAEATKWRHLVLNLKKKGAAPVGGEYVYIGRPGHNAPAGDACTWGNKEKVKWHGGSRRDNTIWRLEQEHQRVVRVHRAWLLARPQEIARARAELRGKRLGCWCAPLPCHGHTLAEVANCSEEWLCRIVDEAFVERINEEKEEEAAE